MQIFQFRELRSDAVQGVTEDGQDGQRMSGAVGRVLEIETGGDLKTIIIMTVTV